MTGGSARGCDLGVAEDPAPAVLAGLYAALRPGGACYVEWRGDDPRPIEQALHAAGFAEVELYRPWPPFAALPAYWVPVNAPGAAGYLRSRRRLRGGRLRRLLGGHPGSRRRAASPAASRDPVRGGAPSVRASRAGSRSRDMAAAGLDRVGPRRPAVATVDPARDGGSAEREQSGAARVCRAEPGAARGDEGSSRHEAAAGVRREGAVLAALAAKGAAAPGVPRLLFRREIDGVPLRRRDRARRASAREPARAAETFACWSLTVADWLAALADRGRHGRAAHWRDVIVEPLLADSRSNSGRWWTAACCGSGARRGASVGDSRRAEQRDFGPWNLLVTSGGRAGRPRLGVGRSRTGCPSLDLLYYLTYASFNVDRAHDAGQPAGLVSPVARSRHANRRGAP